MALWKVTPPELSYGPSDTVADLTKIAAAYLIKLEERKLDKEEKLLNAELTLLAGQLADSRDDVRRSKLVYQDRLEQQEDTEMK